MALLAAYEVDGYSSTARAENIQYRICEANGKAIRFLVASNALQDPKYKIICPTTIQLFIVKIPLPFFLPDFSLVF